VPKILKLVNFFDIVIQKIKGGRFGTWCTFKLDKIYAFK